jgi:DNA/RNA endonuclease G (NUC1)
VEEITKEKLEKREGDRKDSAFLEDVSIPEKFRARLKDYFRSGYDRGHQVQTLLNDEINYRCPLQTQDSLKTQ